MSKYILHGSESVLYLGPKIWDIVPLELKELTSVVAFKKCIRFFYISNTFTTNTRLKLAKN